MPRQENRLRGKRQPLMKMNRKFLVKRNIKQQLYIIYFVALFLPIAIIGCFLLVNTYGLLDDYHKDLMESDNLRVKTILFEITTQVYNISEEMTFDDKQRDFLANNHYIRSRFEEKVSGIDVLDSYGSNYAEIEGIEIYTDNPTFLNYKQFHKADKEIKQSEWYQKAVGQSSVFWLPMLSKDSYGNEYWNLCLIRRIPLGKSKYHAVLVIKTSDNYLRTRLFSQEYTVAASDDNGMVFYSSNRDSYGKIQSDFIDYDTSYFHYVGNREVNGKPCLMEISTLPLYQSDTRLYIHTMNDQAYYNIQNIIMICLLILLLALAIPGAIIHFFTDYFTTRVFRLREAMHQASNEDYEIVNSIQGQDELSEAFSDLVIMVQKIKEKDANMYEARLNEQKLINEQQIMEFKMLTSQVNPHFLYNTLETIRMKALTAGNREIENAVKLLGRSMRYVLENSGTAFTTLQRELHHVETYLEIQKLRFGDKFDSKFEVQDIIKQDSLHILPLLLQPIVENALLHGLEETEAGGMIVIMAHKKQENNQCILRIDISDNGCGMEANVLKELRKNIEVKNISRTRSIGLFNINQRMKLTYGNAYGLRIYSHEGEGTLIRLRIPLTSNTSI